MNTNNQLAVFAADGLKRALRLAVSLVAVLLATGTAGPIQIVSGQNDLDIDAAMAEDYEMSGYQRGGYGRGAYGRGGTSDDTQFLISPVLSLVKSIDLGPLLDPSSQFDVRLGPALEAEAKELFSAGRADLARELFYGHMVAEYDEAAAKVQSVRFSPLLKRPTWQLRFGVSMAIRGGEDVTDPSPIQAGNGYGRGGFVGGMDDDLDYEMVPAGGSQSRGSGRRESGRRSVGRPQRTDFDDPDADMEMLDDMMGMPVSSDPRMGANSPLINGGSPAPETNQRTAAPPMLSSETADRLQEYLGAVAEHCAVEFDKRFTAGDYGTLFNEPETVDAPAEDPNDRRIRSGMKEPQTNFLSTSAASLLRDLPGTGSMWRPGLEFVGEGSSGEMSELASTQQIDYLIHFDVVLKQTGRQNQVFVQNVSRARLIDVSRRKSLIVSKAIDSGEVRQMQSAGRMPDPSAYVTEQMSNLWRAVDRETKLVPMPKLNSESVRRRIGQLIRSGGRRNLRTLSEIRLYQSLGLIDQAEVAKAFDIVGGSDALVLMCGPRQERLDMARTWAMESIIGKTQE